MYVWVYVDTHLNVRTVFDFPCCEIYQGIEKAGSTRAGKISVQEKRQEVYER